ncbi:unnamed protein product [Rotaria socialis]|uniref:Uncharacterized protein n=1 Tax=Rotaria socialis TaxID=392032 RepID=A0A818K2M4_9BILA|nr:unnamed protein product [Rotaria socialis]CAF4569759.1 unnamed protein product [Rotaria socialis]
MTLFAVLLKCHNADGTFDLFEEIMNVYVDPYNGQSAQILSSLLSKSNDYEFPVEQYLDDYENDDDTPHFLDEIDITTDAIIHQSPFNVKACDRIPSLKELIHKEPLEIKPTNPLFATKIVQLFYKWFAYLPLWSGHNHYPSGVIEVLHNMQPLYWPNTVQLTLSIQQPSELTLLLKRGALPATEHLNVTNEEMRTALPLYRYKPISNIQLCEHELRKVADGTRLRSLVLRYINLKDAVILMDSLTMPLLEKLIFVDLYDRTLDHVGKFQEFCSSTYLPALKDLHFSFCFPQEMEHGWQMSSFSCNGKWPFDNLGCYLDDSWISVDGDLNSVTDPLFVVYKRPINVLLQHKRTLHNHRLVEHAIIPIVTNG